jgi:hypothetical protein
LFLKKSGDGILLKVYLLWHFPHNFFNIFFDANEICFFNYKRGAGISVGKGHFDIIKGKGRRHHTTLFTHYQGNMLIELDEESIKEINNAHEQNKRHNPKEKHFQCCWTIVSFFHFLSLGILGVVLGFICCIPSCLIFGLWYGDVTILFHLHFLYKKSASIVPVIFIPWEVLWFYMYVWKAKSIGPNLKLILFLIYHFSNNNTRFFFLLTGWIIVPALHLLIMVMLIIAGFGIGLFYPFIRIFDRGYKAWLVIWDVCFFLSNLMRKTWKFHSTGFCSALRCDTHKPISLPLYK